MPQIAHKGAQWPSLLIIVTQSTAVLDTQLLSKSIFSTWQLLSICPCLKALFELAYFVTSSFCKLTEDRLTQPPTYYSLFELNKDKFSNCITYNQLFPLNKNSSCKAETILPSKYNFNLLDYPSWPNLTKRKKTTPVSLPYRAAMLCRWSGTKLIFIANK